MAEFRTCSHPDLACYAARFAGELYTEYELCPKEAAENEVHIRAELEEEAKLEELARLEEAKLKEAEPEEAKSGPQRL